MQFTIYCLPFTVYQFTSLPVYQFTSLPVYQFTSLPVYQAWHASWLDVKWGESGLTGLGQTWFGWFWAAETGWDGFS